MDKGRLEAFSDGVLAIIITIMVLEMKAPHGATLSELRPLLPVFLSYILSFVYLGIYRITSYNVCYTKLLRCFQHLQRLAIQIPSIPVIVDLEVDPISLRCRLHGLVDDGYPRPTPDHSEQQGDVLLIQSDASVTDALPDAPGTIRAMRNNFV